MLATSSPKYHIILASRSPEKGDAALRALESDPATKSSLSTISLDVTSTDSIAAAFAHVSAHHDRLDILINNAGIYTCPPEPLATQLHRSFLTNSIGPALVSEAFVPLLRQSRNPYLLYISSTLGSLALASDTTRFDSQLDARAYRMSKAALDMLMVQDHKALAGNGDTNAEGKRGIKVFAICPGLVESELRGSTEEQRTCGGRAGSAEGSGRFIQSVVEGERDEDVGKFVHEGGCWPW